MATCLRVPISMPPSMSASSSSSSSRFPPRRLKTTLRTVNAINNKAKILTPLFNPNDPFLSSLASVAASSPETRLTPSSPDTDSLPHLDIFESPQLMANLPSPEVVFGKGNAKRSRRPPPDLPSHLLSGRIVYIGMPLVPVVTELVIAQLMYLQWVDPKEPVYIYINSTGTMRDDGETVAMESEGFAIYDAMMQLKAKTQITTLALGVAAGQACLLLSAGTRGKRYMFPNATAVIQQPRVPSSGLRAASDVIIHAKEAVHNRDTLVELLAKHTRNSKKTVANKMKRKFYMNATAAKEFGVIDKIFYPVEKKPTGDVPSKWESGPFAKAVDKF